MADKVNFRYRGYYYDNETGFYYLQTRYYSPEICRFISADQPEMVGTLSKTLGQLAPYTYCNNNPISYTDEDGTSVLSALLLGAVIGAIVGAASYTASTAIVSLFTGEWNWSWGMFAGSVMGGMVGGMIGISNFCPIFLSGITGFISTASGLLLQNAFGEANNEFGYILIMSAISGVLSSLATHVTSFVQINGFNSGRGSFEQVSRQINTKFIRDQISGITAKTFGKILAYNLGYSGAGVLMSSYHDIVLYILHKQQQKNAQKIGRVPPIVFYM